ncbi:MAG: NYN domain-containing protein [Clostridiaceae bacterium]|mgnify:CR=1 FL=1|nr:NYN domain-containing protein [Clostridiaceae bacterium]
MKNNSELRLAVLIDAENVPHSNIKGILEEIAKYGIPTVKRIYGDWTKPNVAGWKNVLVENAITPIQQYSYTTGKNSSDSAMIIDAMDILYTDKVEGFCIVSSDSDFTRLAIRLRESGMKVIGIGERKTPNSFKSACDRFIYIEIINDNTRQDIEISAEQFKKGESRKMSKGPIIGIGEELINLIASSISDVADDDGWAFLADVGNMIQKKQPDFDSRNFGFAKLTPLIKTLNYFEIDERDSGNGKVKHIYVRNKDKTTTTDKKYVKHKDDHLRR